MSRPARQIALLVLILAALVPAVAHAAPGAVTLVRGAGNTPSGADQSFLGQRIWRMHGATAWQPDTWARRSAYALDTATANANPAWVLKDSLNRWMYVNGLPAADFGNAAYRSWWIAQATAQAAGLRGLYIDDVTMTRRVYQAWGTAATARDPRTGASMSEANWMRYMADFMVQVRAAFPAAEIVHDVLWYRGDTSADIVRELGAATHVALEKGFNDPIIVGGTGTYGWRTLAGYVERRQAAGQGVILDTSAEAVADRMYGLGTFLMFDAGRLALGNDGWTAPGRFWNAYDVDLGAPTSGRTSWYGFWRRDFEHGLVLINEATNPQRVAYLGGGFTDLEGKPVKEMTMPGGSAAVLHLVPVPEPTPTPTPTPSPEPTPAAPEDAVVPVPTATPTPSPRRPTRRSGNPTATIAGAAEPGRTSVTVSVGRISVAGRVKGAVSGYVRVTVQRRRGKGWSTVRSLRPSVGKSGRFEGRIARLSRGTYRVAARFEGTGTAEPSRSGYRARKL